MWFAVPVVSLLAATGARAESTGSDATALTALDLAGQMHGQRHIGGLRGNNRDQTPSRVREKTIAA